MTAYIQTSIVVLNPMWTVSLYDMVCVCGDMTIMSYIMYVHLAGTVNENTVLPKLLRKCKIIYKAHTRTP
jgi:hypothetical protein